MAKTPWYTSNDLIEAVKRKITMPISQNLFSEEDILSFASEELMVSQVPSILEYHEEFFVFTLGVSLVNGRIKYPIPDRAIGMRLRSVFFGDGLSVTEDKPYGSLSELTRISPDDKAYFQNDDHGYTNPYKYYFEGNDVVLSSYVPPTGASGYLVFAFYLRPNQLVTNDRAATCTNFVKNVVISNTSLVAGDTLTVGSLTFTAVSGAPATSLEFQIGGNSVVTASNLVNAINSQEDLSASNGTPASTTVVIEYQELSTEISTSNPISFGISIKQGVKFDVIPENIENNSFIDFLETRGGHKTYSFDIKIPSNAVSSQTIYFNSSQVPSRFLVGDYICSANECIIPQIPSDLHPGLAERTCARILSSMNDQQGLQNVNQKIMEFDKRTTELINNRSDSDPLKILPRHSILRYQKFSSRRRF